MASLDTAGPTTNVSVVGPALEFRAGIAQAQSQFELLCHREFRLAEHRQLPVYPNPRIFHIDVAGGEIRGQAHGRLHPRIVDQMGGGLLGMLIKKACGPADPRIGIHRLEPQLLSPIALLVPPVARPRPPAACEYGVPRKMARSNCV